MERSDPRYQAYVEILKEELIPAMGCTEPIALAYAAARAREVLGALPESVQLQVSGSIIKNVKSVIVPNIKGQQFLIQALTFLLYDLVEENHIEQLPSPVYQLLETGRNPSEELSLHDFQEMLRHCGAQQRE